MACNDNIRIEEYIPRTKGVGSLRKDFNNRWPQGDGTNMIERTPVPNRPFSYLPNRFPRFPERSLRKSNYLRLLHFLVIAINASLRSFVER